jgi:small-conductance mechanosensitive channel
MSTPDVGTSFSEFWDANDQWISAIVALTLAIIVAFVIDRWFVARGRQLAGRVMRGGISQQVDTRLRFIRRLVWLTIILIGVFAALSQFTGVSRIAASVLASGALAAAIIGFAARQTLANLIAGIMITSPSRCAWATG